MPGAFQKICFPLECIPVEASATCDPPGEVGPMASTGNQRIAEMMDLPYYWIQDIWPAGTDARFTPQTDDDWFQRLPQDVESE